MGGDGGGGWDWPAMAMSVAGVCTLLGLVIFNGEIRDAIKKWRR